MAASKRFRKPTSILPRMRGWERRMATFLTTKPLVPERTWIVEPIATVLGHENAVNHRIEAEALGDLDDVVRGQLLRIEPLGSAEIRASRNDFMRREELDDGLLQTRVARSIDFEHGNPLASKCGRAVPDDCKSREREHKEEAAWHSHERHRFCNSSADPPTQFL